MWYCRTKMLNQTYRKDSAIVRHYFSTRPTILSLQRTLLWGSNRLPDLFLFAPMSLPITFQAPTWSLPGAHRLDDPVATHGAYHLFRSASRSTAFAKCFYFTNVDPPHIRWSARHLSSFVAWARCFLTNLNLWIISNSLIKHFKPNLTYTYPVPKPWKTR